MTVGKKGGKDRREALTADNAGGNRKRPLFLSKRLMYSYTGFARGLGVIAIHL